MIAEVEERDHISEFVGLLTVIDRHDLVVRGNAKRWALFSRDEAYRYALVTEVNPDGKGANAFCGLNPSKATHVVPDNTHTKCIEFARLWGFRYNWMLNAFAIRGTDWKTITRVADPVGPANNEILAFAAGHVDRCVAAWGTHAAHVARGARVKRDLVAAGAKLYTFGRFNSDGSPEHPLYMPYAQAPEVWT